MNPQLQIWMPAAVIVLGCILGFYFNYRQLESLRNELSAKIDAVDAKNDAPRGEINARIDALRAEMKLGFAGVRSNFIPRSATFPTGSIASRTA